MNSSTFSISLLLSCLVTAANGFFQSAAKKASPKAVSPFAQEAIDIYGSKYGYNRAPREENFLDSISSFGVPTTDIDGTRILKKTASPGKRMSDLSEAEVVANFNAIAAVYGDERAIGMAKIFPVCLTFDSKGIAGTFEIWGEIFGEEETKEMVARNPGLLAIKPKDAGKNTENTMAFSYIVAFTRPIGVFGPIGLLGLLSIPGIEGATGIPIKQPFFEALGSIF